MEGKTMTLANKVGLLANKDLQERVVGLNSLADEEDAGLSRLQLSIWLLGKSLRQK
jgi:hypothetical protein